MVSRNMLEISANPFYPHVSHFDSGTGIAACEFPVFNSLQFFCYKFFGYAKWYGRFINLLVSSIGLWFFYCLARRLLRDEPAALAAMLFLAASIWFNYSRRNMPDTFAVSLGLMAVEVGWRYLENGKTWALAAFFVLCSAGLLSKMPAACNLPILLIPMFFVENLPKNRKIWLFSAGFVAVALMSAWYFWWVPYLETIGEKLTWPETFQNGWRQIMGQYAPRTWKQFWQVSFHGEFVFWLAVAGLVFVFLKKNWPLLAAVAGWAVVSFAFMLKAGFIFSTHDYYTVPIVPMMAVLAGNAFSLLHFPKKKWALLAIAVAAGTVSAQKQIKWYDRTEDYDFALNKLESLADQVIPKGDKIVVNDYKLSPVLLFWAHRHGTIVENTDIHKYRWLSGKADQGATFAIINKRTLPDSLPFEVALDDPDFRIYKLHKSD